ncbi:polysaccharide deacetylase family protein [Aestuariirhabdus litorea]|uniref:Polysaccharide deacetylase n=1 Tax=Aestuariirhabdus litorea TaxID=2528527 RepID=A0A3P3VSS5_9GAMM|nr:polysaccharide deacetylase family protein [Aestuariirhabdus litorea]RRJ84746.1 hypothetical protein D0544_06505 [Aestuariirhabdus litorea]RWW97971.1 hypothetical protein DZC74_06500 [Endozoicomonadaceae bacterium GTF-13]
MSRATPWEELAAELELWVAADKPLSLWWRDDDATGDSAPLRQLLAFADRHRIPLAAAVIPAQLSPSLALRLRQHPSVSCLLHGYDHISYAPPQERKQELGAHRPPALVLSRLQQGDLRLRQELGDQYQSILVPPWNRISPELIAGLGEIGLKGLSTLGPRPANPPLPINNVHVDLIDWKLRRFAGIKRVISQLLQHLRQRRLGEVDSLEASGIMSHHLVHDTECWEFMEQLLEQLSACPQVRWPKIAHLFERSP